jgi:hypothetical protein
VEIAYYWEQGYGCIRHSEVYLASVPFLAWLWSLYLIIIFKWSDVFWKWNSSSWAYEAP